ncbi:MAG: outer membrane beta-barrel protein [Niastella sp.]|uniref:outer membrane beta-barrel protein n=1 Tax=Niastella sp. TaxID=1869183 RepID=UPI00389A95B7
MVTNCTPIACLLSIALLTLVPVHAQFHVGIKAGIAVSNISVKSSSPAKTNYHSRILGTGGFFAHINLGKKFLLRPELVLTGKGAKARYVTTYFNSNTNTTTQSEYVDRTTFTYIDIPVNLLYVIPLGEKKLLAGAGPVISLLLNKKANYGMETNDMGVNLLLLYEWPIGFSIGANYMQGLKNISYSYSSNRTKNHYLGFTIGYWF